VVISANRNATSVIGRCLPVSTFASLIPVGRGRITDESVTEAIRSSMAAVVIPTCNNVA
jgi:hypothetical protein